MYVLRGRERGRERRAVDKGGASAAARGQMESGSRGGREVAHAQRGLRAPLGDGGRRGDNMCARPSAARRSWRARRLS
eukprot:scaffold5061_cov378-Prasinococcus_capsulatus_cf.AAC.12